MRKGGSREPAVRAAAAVLAAAAGLACLVLTGAAGDEGTGPGAKGRPPESRIVLADSPGARAAAPVLARLWASGFFKRNEAVLREMANYDFAFFGQGAPKPPRGVRGLACFSRTPGERDTVYLRQDLFAHFDVGLDGVVERVDISGRVLPVLVHEICHDLWANVLDDRERAAFSREGEAFMRDYRRAQTADEVRRFLAGAGDDAADPRCLRSYAGIGDILAANPTRAMCGHEMFAWLAERLFTTRALIPCPLRKYYACVLAELPPAAQAPSR